MKTEDFVEKKRTHYSDEELAEFRPLILDKLTKARQDLELLSEDYNEGSNEHLDTSHTFKVLEEAQNVISKEENAKAALRQKKFIQSLENALVRIENKTYGVCAETGDLICKERLRSAPHCTLSIEGKRLRDQNERNKIGGFPQNTIRKPFAKSK